MRNKAYIFYITTMLFSLAFNKYSAATSSNLIEIESQQQYHQLLKSGNPSVVEVYATWCGACKIAKPKVEKLAQTHADVQFLLVEEGASCAKQIKIDHSVKAYPTFLIFDANGTYKDHSQGFNQAKIEKILSEMGKGSVVKPIKIKTGTQPEMQCKKQKIKKTEELRSPSNLITLKNKKEFDQLLQEKKIKLLDFYTTWCGPCKMLAPIIEKISHEYSDVLFIKIDAEKFSELIANKSDLIGKINCYPTVIVLDEENKIFKRSQGGPREETLKDYLDQALGKKPKTITIKEEKIIMNPKK